eukprot:GHVS01082902.1.p1 GENE.GHVS01082902.1~~GHVS01082902.1.p1  ORF type:complete len:271 (-),score=12.17 GHVS01082902.1:313-1125(-)
MLWHIHPYMMLMGFFVQMASIRLLLGQLMCIAMARHVSSFYADINTQDMHHIMQRTRNRPLFDEPLWHCGYCYFMILKDLFRSNITGATPTGGQNDRLLRSDDGETVTVSAFRRSGIADPSKYSGEPILEPNTKKMDAADGLMCRSAPKEPPPGPPTLGQQREPLHQAQPPVSSVDAGITVQDMNSIFEMARSLPSNEVLWHCGYYYFVQADKLFRSIHFSSNQTMYEMRDRLLLSQDGATVNVVAFNLAAGLFQSILESPYWCRSKELE